MTDRKIKGRKRTCRKKNKRAFVTLTTTNEVKVKAAVRNSKKGSPCILPQDATFVFDIFRHLQVHCSLNSPDTGQATSKYIYIYKSTPGHFQNLFRNKTKCY